MSRSRTSGSIPAGRGIRAYWRGSGRTKATNDRPVLWVCPAEPGKRASYPTSPMARANWLTRAKPGCPVYRKGTTKVAQRARRAKQDGDATSSSAVAATPS
jgi:hypothetical protein